LAASRPTHMLKLAPLDVWIATAIALLAMVLVAIFDQSPMLFVVIILTLCVYVVVETIFEKFS
jgi:hypothetical protein